jgi:pimeloyl-ACP methyl ester carboxylesterase
MREAVMPEVVNDGVRISYDVSGEGPAIVLLHGWSCDRTWWNHAGFVGRLEQDNRVVNIDLRGNGRSDKPHEPAGYHMPLLEADVLGVADAEGIDRFTVWGLSYGGWVGWMLAADHPGRVNALVTSGAWDPAPEEVDESDDSYATGTVGALRRAGTAGLVEFYLDGVADRADIEYPVWAQQATLAADPEALVAMEAPELYAYGLTDLEAFPVPALLISGELEDPENDAAKTAARLPHGESLWLPGLGHGGACSASELSVPVARAFLATIDR